MSVRYPELNGSPVYGIPPNAEGLECPCGGFMRRDTTTALERMHGCGRDKEGRECCARAFVCRLCQKRVFGTAEAPEME